MRRKSTFLSFVTIAFVFATLPMTAPAYVLEGPSWNTSPTVTFRMGLGNPGRTLLDGNTSWDAAATPALTMWNQNIQRTQILTVAGTSSASSGDGLNSVVFSTTVFGQSFGSSTLAVTYYRYSGSRMSEADILFNQNKSFDSYRGSLRSATDIRRVLLHEMGHGIGLGHPDQSGQHVSAIMNSVVSSLDALSSDDIAGGHSLYGTPGPSPTPTPTPNPTPTPTPSPTPVPTPTPTPTPTPSATPTPTPTPTPNPTPVVKVVASPTLVKGGQTATYTITTSVVNPNAAVTIKYAMSGTALRGTQYSLAGTYGQVVLQAGASSTTVKLTVLTAPKKTKTAIMTLTSGAGYSLSTPKTATVSIRK